MADIMNTLYIECIFEQIVKAEKTNSSLFRSYKLI